MTTELVKPELGIGGSEAAAACGMNPYTSRTQLYMEKLGLVDKPTMNDNMWWGIMLEPTILEMCEEFHAPIVNRQDLFVHKKHDFMYCHPDGIVGGQVVEAKSARRRDPQQWGENGTDEVPQSYILQAQHNMVCTDTGRCILPVLFRTAREGEKFAIYYVDRDEELISDMVKQEMLFMTCLRAKLPPEDRDTDAQAELLKKLYNRDQGQTIEGTPEVDQMVRAYFDIEAQEKMIGREKLTRRVEIEKVMKDAAILVGKDYRITWKNNADSIIVDKDAVLAECMEKFGRHAVNEMISRFTTVKPGARVFRPKQVKEEDE